MCGILVACRQAPLDVWRFMHALGTLAHRGPDGQGLWVSADARQAVGFRRLALVGPDHESQPFASPDGQVQVVVNGEIYGHASMRRELEAQGARFRTGSDCEVVLHGYLHGGSEYLRRLNGEFAIVILDQRVGRLVAARDPWGVKPLYYAAGPDGISLASEIKALFDLGHDPRWDQARLLQHLFASVGPSQTLFEGVAQVRPGHVLEWDGSGIRTAPLLCGPRPAAGSDTAASLMTRLVAGLGDAVQDRFQGHARVGCYLSGGIDSTVVATLAARHGSTRPDAFTVDFGDGIDAREAAATAAGLGMRHHVIEVSSADLVRNFDASVRHAETVGFNSIGAARWQLSRSLREAGCKVALVGDGSDELLGGYGFSVMDSLCQQSPAHALRMQEMLLQGKRAVEAGMGGETALFDMAALGLDGPCPYLLSSWNVQRSEVRRLLSPGMLATLADFHPYLALLDDIGMAEVRARRGLQRSMYIWQQSLFANHILLAERLDMAHGVESRYPFLDRRVAQVAAAAPDDVLVRDMREKWLLRQAVHEMLPAASAHREKRPFVAPALFAGTGAPFQQYLNDMLESRAARESCVFDARALRRVVAALPCMPQKVRERVDSLLMMVLSFFALQRSFEVSEWSRSGGSGLPATPSLLNASGSTT